MSYYSLQHSLPLGHNLSTDNDKINLQMMLREIQVRSSRNQHKPRTSNQRHLVCLPNKQRMWPHSYLAMLSEGFCPCLWRTRLLWASPQLTNEAAHLVVAPYASPPTFSSLVELGTYKDKRSMLDFLLTTLWVFSLRIMAATSARGFLGRNQALFCATHSQPPRRKTTYWLGVTK